MSSVRVETAAALLQDSKLLVTGGFNGIALNSAEIFSGVEWESNIPSLPVTVQGHCMVTINSTTLIVIGGLRDDQFSRKTFYFSIEKESWTEGPELQNIRIYHSCGKIRKNKESQEMSIIVVGGFDASSILSSVEILDESSNEWKTGPELSLGIYYSQVVGDQKGGIVLIGGESPLIGILDTLYQLPHGGQDAAWSKMEQKLTTKRSWHTAFLVPDNIVDCS